MDDEAARKALDKLDWRSFTPADSPKGLPDIVPEMKDLGTPDLAVGDRAFDFTLPVSDFSDGTEVSSGERFTLSAEAEQRPVALIFGSYT